MQVTEGNFRPVKIAIRLFGREVLAAEISHPEEPVVDAEPHEPTAADGPDPYNPAPPAPEPRTLGFHGGSGGSTDLAWQPNADRPILT